MVVTAPFTLGVETVCQVCEPAAEYTRHAAECMQLLLATVSKYVCCAIQDQPVWISGPERGGIPAGLWCPQSCGSIDLAARRKGGGLEVLRP